MDGATCPDCGAAIGGGIKERPGVCPSCGWRGSRPKKKAVPRSPTENANSKDPEKKSSERTRKKRRRRANSSEGRALRISGYVIGTGLVIVLWALLAWRSDPYGLLFSGMFVALTAVLWLYYCAAQEGAELFTVLSSSSPSAFVRLLIIVIEIALMPLISLVYLVLYFESTWKPFLIEMLGLGMIACGVWIFRHQQGIELVNEPAALALAGPQATKKPVYRKRARQAPAPPAERQAPLVPPPHEPIVPHPPIAPTPVPQQATSVVIDQPDPEQKARAIAPWPESKFDPPKILPPVNFVMALPTPLVTTASQAPLVQELAAQPPVGLGDRTGVAKSVPTPPASWTAPPASPPPLSLSHAITNAPHAQAFFGITHVAFIGNPTKSGGSGSEGQNWLRFDLRANSVSRPLSVPLWPRASNPKRAGNVDDSQQTFVAAMSNDGERLVVRDPADAARVDVWDAAGKRLLGMHPYGDKPVQWVSWSAEDRLLTLGDGCLTAWDVFTGKAVFEVNGNYRLPAEAARGRGWLALSAGDHIDVLDTSSGACFGRLALGGLPYDSYQSLAISPNGAILTLCCRGDGKRSAEAAVGGDGLLRVWDLAVGKEREPVVVSRNWGSPTLLLDDHRALLSSCVYDLNNCLPSERYAFSGSVAGIGPDGRLWMLTSPPGVGSARTRLNSRERILSRRSARVSDQAMLRAVELVPASQKLLDRSYILDRHTPLVVEADLGDIHLSRKLAENQVNRLTADGFTVGPSGWRLRAGSHLVSGKFDRTYARWLGNRPAPALQVNWHLLTPDGTMVWNSFQVACFDSQSRYRKNANETSNKIGTSQEVKVEFDFGGRDPRQAILEEINEKAVNLTADLPPARYYAAGRRWTELPMLGVVRFRN